MNNRLPLPLLFAFSVAFHFALFWLWTNLDTQDGAPGAPSLVASEKGNRMAMQAVVKSKEAKLTAQPSDALIDDALDHEQLSTAARTNANVGSEGEPLASTKTHVTEELAMHSDRPTPKLLPKPVQNKEQAVNKDQPTPLITKTKAKTKAKTEALSVARTKIAETPKPPSISAPTPATRSATKSPSKRQPTRLASDERVAQPVVLSLSEPQSHQETTVSASKDSSSRLASTTPTAVESQQSIDDRAPAEDVRVARPDVGTLLKRLREAVERKKRYPLVARRSGREGTATVGFRLHVDGRFEQVGILESSGYRPLDRAAIKAVQSVNPFPEAAGFLAEARNMKLRIAFVLR